MTKTKYAVNWDNGNKACGTFPNRFDTWAEAQDFADDWARERNLEDLGLDDAQVEDVGGEGCYTAEVIEVEGEADQPVREEIEKAKSAIDAIARDREISLQDKLDALEEIQRHAEKRDGKVRAAIRRKVKGGRQ